jgi:hypothetical protein
MILNKVEDNNMHTKGATAPLPPRINKGRFKETKIYFGVFIYNGNKNRIQD